MPAPATPPRSPATSANRTPSRRRSTNSPKTTAIKPSATTPRSWTPSATGASLPWMRESELCRNPVSREPGFRDASLLRIHRRAVRADQLRHSRQITPHLAERLEMQGAASDALGGGERRATHQLLDRGHERRAHAQPPQAHAEQGKEAARPGGHLAAQGHRHVLLIA